MMYGSANASNAAPNNDTDSPVVPGSSEGEGVRRQGEFSDVDEADMEKANRGQMDDNKDRVQQAGSGSKEATTSLPGKKEQGQRDQSGVQDDNAQDQVAAAVTLIGCLSFPGNHSPPCSAMRFCNGQQCCYLAVHNYMERHSNLSLL